VPLRIYRALLVVFGLLAPSAAQDLPPGALTLAHAKQQGSFLPEAPSYYNRFEAFQLCRKY
jgi:hypothetical protein